MQPLIISPDSQRGTYERVVGDLASLMGIGADAFKQTYKVFQSTVLMATPLSSGISSYSLSPRKGVDPLIPTAVLLDQNDFFAVSGIGLRYARATYSSTNQSLSQFGNYPKLTYPDATFFNGNPATGLDEWQCLQTIQNGTLSISVTGDTLLDSVSCQELTAKLQTGYNSSGPVLPQFGGSEGDRGIFPITPQLILDASADNLITVQLADGDKAVIDGSVDSSGAATTHRNILYVVLYGWKIKNFSGKGVSACRI
jgi:hypothetical protein